MCLGSQGSSKPAKAPELPPVQPVPPNVIDRDDARNFPNADGVKDFQVPSSTPTSPDTGLQIPS